MTKRFVIQSFAISKNNCPIHPRYTCTHRTGWWWHWPVRWPLWTLTYHCRTAGTRGTTPPDTAAVPWTRSTAWTRLRIAEHRVKVKSGSKFISLTFVYIYTCTPPPPKKVNDTVVRVLMISFYLLIAIYKQIL